MNEQRRSKKRLQCYKLSVRGTTKCLPGHGEPTKGLGNVQHRMWEDSLAESFDSSHLNVRRTEVVALTRSNNHRALGMQSAVQLINLRPENQLWAATPNRRPNGAIGNGPGAIMGFFSNT